VIFLSLLPQRFDPQVDPNTGAVTFGGADGKRVNTDGVYSEMRGDSRYHNLFADLKPNADTIPRDHDGKVDRVAIARDPARWAEVRKSDPISLGLRKPKR
jgi:hypothetical protein